MNFLWLVDLLMLTLVLDVIDLVRLLPTECFFLAIADYFFCTVISGFFPFVVSGLVKISACFLSSFASSF